MKKNTRAPKTLIMYCPVLCRSTVGNILWVINAGISIFHNINSKKIVITCKLKPITINNMIIDSIFIK